MKKISIAVLVLLLVSNFIYSARIQPSDLTYLGAFRLPDGEAGSEVRTWAWGGYAMTYYPGGDPGGPEDGYPGSIFGAGHAWAHQVSEITIPVPVISASKNVNHLNTASTLQSFRDIFDVSDMEMPRTGLAYLVKQGSQTSDKLYLCWGMHLVGEEDMTHGWCELNLSNPQVKGGWYVDCPHNEYNSNDYLFEIPSSWAASNTPGKLLATGRYRDGGWSGRGPSLFAIGPWNQGNPPSSGTSLQYVTLLRYVSSEDSEDETQAMTDYHDSDEWSGAVWLTAGDKSAVLFVGTKGTGDCWYGDSNGPCTECEGERGWWSTGFEGRFIFYDPEDLAKVAAGTMESWEPQPYASLNIDQYLYHITSTQQWYHLGAACFDSTRGFLYVFEPLVDDDKPLVHVWKLKTATTTGPAISLSRTQIMFGASLSGPAPGSQKFTIANSGSGTLNWTVSDNRDWLSCTPSSGTDEGIVTVSVDTAGLSAGDYSGTISVSAAGAVNSPQSVDVTLEVYGSGSSGEPFGYFSTPLDGSTVRSSIPVTGWALDDIGVESVKIYRQSGGSLIFIGDAVFVEGARPDVEQAYPGYPMNYKAGWGYMMLTNFLPGNGNGTFTIYAVAADREGNEVILGTKTITCDNAHAEKPFGAIDTPAQGGTASGNSYVNWGWALTPQPNKIPTDGSTVNVIVDGVNLGHPAYNVYRSDIAGLFPDYANSNGAVGYFYLDTTAYENGVHTIQWTAVDNAGNTDGIGSRYFTIENTGGDLRSSVNGKQRTVDSKGLLRFIADDTEPVAVTRGYTGDNISQEVYPDDTGIITIQIKELERIEVHLTQKSTPSKGWRGYLVCGSVLKPLPVGSTFDVEKGVFYWLPGPGYVGEYKLLFMTGEERDIRLKKRIFIKILPLHAF